MFFKELSSRNEEKTPTCYIKPPLHKSISAQHPNFKQNLDNYESNNENEQVYFFFSKLKTILI